MWRRGEMTARKPRGRTFPATLTCFHLDATFPRRAGRAPDVTQMIGKSSRFQLRRAMGLALACALPSLARAAVEPARAADGFVDSMGTNIHSAFGGNFTSNV